jgi:hypothetical protein
MSVCRPAMNALPLYTLDIASTQAPAPLAMLSSPKCLCASKRQKAGQLLLLLPLRRRRLHWQSATASTTAGSGRS